MYSQGNCCYTHPCTQPRVFPVISCDTRVFNCKTSDSNNHELVKGGDAGSRFIKQLVAGSGINITEGDCSLIISDQHQTGFVLDVENTGGGVGKLVVPEDQSGTKSQHPKIKTIDGTANGFIENNPDKITIHFPTVTPYDDPGTENEYMAVRNILVPGGALKYEVEFLNGVFEDLLITDVGSVPDTPYTLKVYENNLHSFFGNSDREGLRQIIMIRGWYFTVESKDPGSSSVGILPFPAYNSSSGPVSVTLKKKDWVHFLEPVSTIVGGKHATRAIGTGTKKSMYPYVFNSGGTGDFSIDVENTLGQRITVSHGDKTTLRIPAPLHKLAAVGQSFDIITINGPKTEGTGNLQSCTGEIIIELKPEDSLIYSGNTTKHITQFVVKPVIDTAAGAPTSPTSEMGITSHLRFTYDYRLRTDPVVSPANVKNMLGWRVHSLFLGTDWVDHLDGQQIPSWGDSVTSP